jgi:hypothetical protein
VGSWLKLDSEPTVIWEGKLQDNNAVDDVEDTLSVCVWSVDEISWGSSIFGVDGNEEWIRDDEDEDVESVCVDIKVNVDTDVDSDDNEGEGKGEGESEGEAKSDDVDVDVDSDVDIDVDVDDDDDVDSNNEDEDDDNDDTVVNVDAGDDDANETNVFNDEWSTGEERIKMFFCMAGVSIFVVRTWVPEWWGERGFSLLRTGNEDDKIRVNVNDAEIFSLKSCGSIRVEAKICRFFWKIHSINLSSNDFHPFTFFLPLKYFDIVLALQFNSIQFNSNKSQNETIKFVCLFVCQSVGINLWIIYE